MIHRLISSLTDTFTIQGHGENFITIAHAQALCLIAAFEAKCMLFTRASTNCAKAVRLCQMMGLDRLDGSRDDLPPALGPTTSCEELEERRRVFWGAFSIDSHASISTGWPALINPDDVGDSPPVDCQIEGGALHLAAKMLTLLGYHETPVLGGGFPSGQGRGVAIP